MDLEDWELLPKDPYKGLDHEEDHDAGMMITRNSEKSLDMDYFICPKQDYVGKTEFHRRVVPTQLLQVPLTWEPVSTVDDTDIKKNQDSVPSPRITFKQEKENEFVGMKIDLPERFTSPLPQNDDKHSVSEYHDEMGTEVDESGDLRSKKEVNWEEEENRSGEKLNIWKMGLHGIGAICSFGVAAAAATFCVFFLGHNNSIHGCRNKNQILRFQLYSDDNKGNPKSPSPSLSPPSPTTASPSQPPSVSVTSSLSRHRPSTGETLSLFWLRQFPLTIEKNETDGLVFGYQKVSSA